MAALPPQRLSAGLAEARFGSVPGWVRELVQEPLKAGAALPPWGAPCPQVSTSKASPRHREGAQRSGSSMRRPRKPTPTPCTAVISLSLAPTVQGCSETQQTRVSGEGCSVPGCTRGSPGRLCRCCACFLMACAVCFSVCVVSPVKWKWSSESAQPLPAHADAGAATSPRHAPLGRLS